METQAPTLFWLFFGFKGRIARRSFALGSFFLVLPHIFVLLQMVRADEDSGALIAWTLVLFLVLAFSLWSIFALIVKRLHDIGVTGFLSLAIVLTGLYIIAMLILCFWPSQQKTNDYGPPPFAV